MQCPKCRAKFAFAVVRPRFACPSCNAPLSYSITAWLFISLFLGGVPWLVLEALVFQFRSTAISVVVLAGSCVVVATVAAMVIKPKIDSQSTA